MLAGDFSFGCAILKPVKKGRKMQDINENINELIENAMVVILLFGDESCAPCHALKQKIDRWHEDFPEVETDMYR